MSKVACFLSKLVQYWKDRVLFLNTQRTPRRVWVGTLGKSCPLTGVILGEPLPIPELATELDCSSKWLDLWYHKVKSVIQIGEFLSGK